MQLIGISNQPRFSTQKNFTMKKLFSFILSVVLSSLCTNAIAYRLVDALTDSALPLASISDSGGNVIGMTDRNGEIPELSPKSYPVTFSYLGYAPIESRTQLTDDVKMIPKNYVLPEIVIIPGARPLLHLTGFMRETASVLCASDSVTLIKESIVDFLVPVEKSKVKGWRDVRELASKTYVRMTNNQGLDSVSDRHQYDMMLMASDFMAIPASIKIPESIKGKKIACDTIMGKYTPKNIWMKNDAVTRCYRDGLADNKDHTMSPFLFKLFGLTTDFKDMSVNYVFATSDSDELKPTDLQQVSLSLNLIARGKMFKMAMGNSSSMDVRSYVELYLTDREFLSDEEGKDLKKNPPVIKASDIVAPADATPVLPAIRSIVERVNSQRAGQK